MSPTSSEVNALEKKGYVISRKIGQGSYATVHLAEYSEGGRRVKLACKIFDKERAPKDFLDNFSPASWILRWSKLRRHFTLLRGGHICRLNSSQAKITHMQGN